MNRYSKFVKKKELKETRQFKKLSYQDMSDLLGFKSKISYYNIENGIVEPKISSMVKISKVLEKPCEYFFTL